MPNSFLVNTSLTSEEILVNLKNYIQDTDMIFINKVDKDDVASLYPNEVEFANSR